MYLGLFKLYPEKHFRNLIFLFCQYVGERWQYIKVSQTWEDSGSVTKSMGSHAYTYAGGNYFDHRSDTDGSSAVYYEGYMLDSYNGHSNGSPEYQYHYHAVSIFEIFPIW